MDNVKDIFTQLDVKIKETLSFEPEITDEVKAIEAFSEYKREYGNGEFQPLIQSLKDDIPAIITRTNTEGANGDNTTTGMDQYFIPCACITVVSGRTQRESLTKAQKIIFYLETCLRNQKSGLKNYSGHGGMTWDNPVSTFEFVLYNNKYFSIVTTEFTVYSVQEFDVV